MGITFRERQPLFQVGIGAAFWTPGLRLPEGAWWQWTSNAGAGIPCSIRYVYGSGFTTAAIETLLAGALSAVHVHPGHDVFVQFQAAIGVTGVFFVVGDL